MRNFWVRMLLLSSAILSWDLIGLKSAIAATSNANTQQINPSIQVAENQPSISDVVHFSDSAFAALADIIERYGCTPDSYKDCQFRCPFYVTRIEFAEQINNCTEFFNRFIVGGEANLIRQEDVDTLKRLEQEFATELATIRCRNRNSGTH